MTPPSRKKARPVRKPRSTPDVFFYADSVLIPHGWPQYDLKQARKLHAQLGRYIAWRADQERRGR